MITRLPIKLVICAIGLAFVLATPAEAAKRKHRAHVTSKPVVRTAAPPAQSTAVYYGDKYVGADPDPRIRHELLRDLGVVLGATD